MPRILMEKARPAPLISLLLAIAAAWQAAGAAGGQAIQVTNYQDGETIRYPVPLLRGTLAGAAATAVTVVNASSKRDTREIAGLAHKGRFKALTELVPGENKLLLRSGRAEVPLTLRYKPQTNPYVVRIIYLTDTAGDTQYQTPLANDPQDFRGKLDTAMKLMQTFTAESLHDQGLPRAAFNLELGPDGKVDVHLLRGDRSMADYHTLDGNQLWGHAAGLVARQLPSKTATNLVVPAFTRFDPKTKKVYSHTALGGGTLALFGGGDLFAWPNSLKDAQKAFTDATRVDPAKLFSDSVGRHTFWANASTTIGAALHELGHTFGLPHSRDPHDIMTRGIDRLNRFFTFVEPPHAGRKDPYEFKDDETACWAPVSAQALVPSRFFAMDARPFSDEPRTGIRLDAASASLIVESDNGIRYISVNAYGDNFGTEAIYPIPLERGKEPPTLAAIPVAAIGKRVASTQVSLHVIDGQGLTTWARVPELFDGPFVQAWRFADATLPWKDAKAFPQVDETTLKQIEASAAKASLVRSRGPFVDFNALSPAKGRAFVASYAVRTIRSEAPRKLKLITGSDDALRVWLNGRLVQSVLALRGAAPNADTAEVELRQGENTLVAEVSQAGGGWGLFLRLEDAGGAKLELHDDGSVEAVDARAADRIKALLLGPFVRKWRLAPETRPWRDKGSFVPLDAAALRVIEASAASASLVGDEAAPCLDLTQLFPKDRQTDVAAYAFRLLRSDRAREVRFFTGSDDALRVWLNGKLVVQVLELRGVKPDSESAEAMLEKGENRLLVEVSNGVGGWGLALRIEDSDGKDLLLADDGNLTPAS